VPVFFLWTAQQVGLAIPFPPITFGENQDGLPVRLHIQGDDKSRLPLPRRATHPTVGQVLITHLENLAKIILPRVADKQAAFDQNPLCKLGQVR
jgi:hypothetical protein